MHFIANCYRNSSLPPVRSRVIYTADWDSFIWIHVIVIRYLIGSAIWSLPPIVIDDKEICIGRTSVDLAPVHCLNKIVLIMFDCLIFVFMHFHWLRCQWRSNGQMCLFKRVQYCGVPIVVTSLYGEGIPYEYRGNTQITIIYVSWLISLLIIEQFWSKFSQIFEGIQLYIFTLDYQKVVY